MRFVMEGRVKEIWNENITSITDKLSSKKKKKWQMYWNVYKTLVLYVILCQNVYNIKCLRNTYFKKNVILASISLNNQLCFSPSNNGE